MLASVGGARTAQSFHRLPLSWAQLERNGVRLATFPPPPDPQGAAIADQMHPMGQSAFYLLTHPQSQPQGQQGRSISLRR